MENDSDEVPPFSVHLKQAKGRAAVAALALSIAGGIGGWACGLYGSGQPPLSDWFSGPFPMIALVAAVSLIVATGLAADIWTSRPRSAVEELRRELKALARR